MAKKGEKKKLCFVIGPIGEPDSDVRVHADWLLEEIIEPIFRDLPEYEVIRADKISQPGMIDAQVIRNLIDAELVIADLSMVNPSAFYEIGIRHMVQKAIIHVQLAEDRIPFDVSLYRATKFSRTRPSDLRRAREELRQAVASVCAEDYEVDNPVTRARGQIKLEQHATPEQKVLMEQLKSIQLRLETIEEGISSGSSDQAQRAILSRRSRKRPSGAVVMLDPSSKQIDAARAKVTDDLLKRGLMWSAFSDEIVIPLSKVDWDSTEDIWRDISTIEGVSSVLFRNS
jgi:hypothetical protein